jgi:hypothetical protein
MRDIHYFHADVLQALCCRWHRRRIAARPGPFRGRSGSVLPR